VLCGEKRTEEPALKRAFVNKKGRLDATCCAKRDMLNVRYVFRPSVQCSLARITHFSCYRHVLILA